MPLMPDAGMAPEQEELTPLDHLRAAIEHAQGALTGEPDDADSASLAKVVQQLYAILAQRQDAEMKAGGGDPKQLRQISRAYAQ